MYAIGSSTTASRASRLAALRRCLRPARGLQQERGASSLELAFVAILIFVCIAGVVDLAGGFQHYIVAINASREGARMYARVPCNGSNAGAVRSAIEDAAVGEGESGRIVLLRENVTLTPNPSFSCPASGATVTVSVHIDYIPFMGAFWSLPSFPINASTSMMYY